MNKFKNWSIRTKGDSMKVCCMQRKVPIVLKIL